LEESPRLKAFPPWLSPRRRFPAPWTVEERPACYIVKDATGFALAYVYYEEEPGRRTASKLMTQDEALFCMSFAQGEIWSFPMATKCRARK
jgi:hypothetical protein